MTPATRETCTLSHGPLVRALHQWAGMARTVDGQTQARAVRLTQERTRLQAALDTRDANRRRHLAVPLEVLGARARFLEAALVRLGADVTALERGLARQSGRAVRVQRLLAGLVDVVALAAFLGAWLLGAWLVSAHADWPPSLAVACTGLPVFAFASAIKRSPR